MGCACAVIGRGEDIADPERAIHAYERALAATPAGSPDLLGRWNNLGNGLRDRYARTGHLPDLERAIAAWEKAWSTLEGRLLASPVDYKLGQQQQWAGMCARLVAAHLDAARADPPQAPAALRRALEVSEGTKSRLLTELLSRAELPAPSTIPLA